MQPRLAKAPSTGPALSDNSFYKRRFSRRPGAFPRPFSGTSRGRLADDGGAPRHPGPPTKARVSGNVGRFPGKIHAAGSIFPSAEINTLNLLSPARDVIGPPPPGAASERDRRLTPAARWCRRVRPPTPLPRPRGRHGCGRLRRNPWSPGPWRGRR